MAQCKVMKHISNETDITCFVEEIMFATHNKNIEVRHLDLSSMASIRLFAKTIHEMEDKVDVLINNAGAAGLADKRTADELQILMAINHFGPFLLTNLLLGNIHNYIFCL